ncbi:helix-turn-helix domain-containing protein [Streptomyces parvulus]|uniref:helix-turn-helix domain-containing protein n=1 Tax=Streptomyces parvulus TaxID=146923 RepID=UPI003EBCBE3F
MTTADDLLAEDGSVRVLQPLAGTVANAVSLFLGARQRADGGTLTPDARALLAALNRAATQPVSATKPAGGQPANVMLGMGDAAALLGCSPQYARRLAARGEIPGAQRVGRIWLVPSNSLDAFHHERQEDDDGEAADQDGDHARRTAEQEHRAQQPH